MKPSWTIPYVPANADSMLATSAAARNSAL